MRRLERVERSFAHTGETGGGRRTWLRGVGNVSKSYLGRAAACNQDPRLNGTRSAFCAKPRLQCDRGHWSACDRVPLPVAGTRRHGAALTLSVSRSSRR